MSVSASYRRDAIDAAAAGMMIVLSFSWGLNGVAAKLSTIGYSPIFVGIARSAIGAVLVYLWCRYRRIVLFEHDGTLWPGLLAGLLFGFQFMLIFFSLDYTSVARNAMMLSTMPLWVQIGAHFLLGERMSLFKLAGLTIAFSGVAVVFADELSLPSAEAIKGDLMSLGAGVLWAATTLIIRRSSLATATAEKVLLYQLVISALMGIPLLLFTGPALRGVSLVATGALLFQGIYIATFVYILWFWLMRRYSATGLTSFTFLTPVFGVLCGGLILGEPLTAKLLIALVLIAVGLAFVNGSLAGPRRHVGDN